MTLADVYRARIAEDEQNLADLNEKQEKLNRWFVSVRASLESNRQALAALGSDTPAQEAASSSAPSLDVDGTPSATRPRRRYKMKANNWRKAVVEFLREQDEHEAHIREIHAVVQKQGHGMTRNSLSSMMSRWGDKEHLVEPVKGEKGYWRLV